MSETTEPPDSVHAWNAPSVTGRHVLLRPVRRQDYELLYQFAVEPRNAFRWRLRGATPDPRTFENTLWEQVLVQLAITLRGSDRPIGIVTCFAADMRSGTANLAILVEDKYTTGILGGEALFLFIDYVLGLWNFRKLYADMPEFNFASVASGASRWFNIEARLPERYWFIDKYWANFVLAVDRRDWRELAERLGPAIHAK